jgi:hypothetical protein
VERSKGKAVKKKSAEGMTNAARTEAVFKPEKKDSPPLDGQALEKKAFDDNREGLKAERLAREADALMKKISG